MIDDTIEGAASGTPLAGEKVDNAAAAPEQDMANVMLQLLMRQHEGERSTLATLAEASERRARELQAELNALHEQLARERAAAQSLRERNAVLEVELQQCIAQHAQECATLHAALRQSEKAAAQLARAPDTASSTALHDSTTATCAAATSWSTTHHSTIDHAATSRGVMERDVTVVKSARHAALHKELRYYQSMISDMLAVMRATDDVAGQTTWNAEQGGPTKATRQLHAELLFLTTVQLPLLHRELARRASLLAACQETMSAVLALCEPADEHDRATMPATLRDVVRAARHTDGATSHPRRPRRGDGAVAAAVAALQRVSAAESKRAQLYRHATPRSGGVAETGGVVADYSARVRRTETQLSGTKMDQVAVVALRALQAVQRHVTQCAEQRRHARLAGRCASEQVERLDVMLDRCREERDDARQELDAMRLVVDALHCERTRLRCALAQTK